MASAFGHAAVSFALGQSGIVKSPSWGLLFAGIVLSILPDADSMGFAMGVPYGSFWGHRGFSHSIVFALLVALFCQQLFFRKGKTDAEALRVFIFLFLSCASHAVLDAMTTGGLGVAFFSPFNNQRYFFPFRPIKVSPINVHAFFEGKGLAVIKSEAVWIGIPCGIVVLAAFTVRLIKKAVLKS
jgi:inner membrane protein